jgi:hypothetical protein
MCLIQCFRVFQILDLKKRDIISDTIVLLLEKDPLKKIMCAIFL